MQFERRDFDSPPDDGLTDLFELASGGAVEAYQLQPWSGQRILDSFSYRKPPGGARRVEVVSLGHGRKWSHEGWVGISTWQSWTERARSTRAVSRGSLAQAASMQVHDWVSRGIESRPRPDSDFIGALTAIGFEALGQFGPVWCWTWTAKSGALVVVSAVGPLPKSEFSLTRCVDFMPYINGARADMQRRLGR